MANINEEGRRIQFIKLELPIRVVYHNHKEIMAHACAVLEIGILAWVMTKDGWKLLQTNEGFACFVILWILIHLYLRWELRNRRKASILIASYFDYLQEWGSGVVQTKQEPKQQKICWFVCGLIFDFLIPCFRGTFPETRVRKDWNLYFGEWLPTGISWLVLLAVVQRKYDLLTRLWDVAILTC